MQDSFLYECADSVLKSGLQLDDLCLIVPNDRTRIYLNTAFAQIAGKAQWAPNIFGMRDMAQRITGLFPENKTTLIFKLYDVFKKHFGHRSSLQYNLESFYGLGETLLNDFNEIDNWLVDPKAVFRNVEQISEIDKLYDYLSENQKQALKEFHLLFSEEQRSAEKEKMYQLRAVLPELYQAFTGRLLQRKYAYNGLIMREMSRVLPHKPKALNRFKKYYFIGFNALTKAEMSLVDYLLKEGKADYFQDADAYYMDNDIQEAGHFMRLNHAALKLPPFKQVQRIPAKGEKKHRKIGLYAVPQNMAQAKIIPELLKNIKQPGPETVIVLADESMMMPVLHALPEQVKEVNVSMGIPLKETKLFGLIRQYVKMHKNDDIGSSAKTYSYAVLSSVLRHPLIHAKIKDKTDRLLKHLADKNISAMPAAELIDEEEPIFKLLFAAIPPDNAGLIFLTNLLNLLFLVFERKEGEALSAKETIENEAIHLCYKSIKKLKELLDERTENFSIAFTARLLMKVIGELSVPFRGKKVSGLQILGVLETRNLDFENLIVLGMNEGQFPKTRHYSGFLSHSIRYAFDLPLIQHQDAVYAYLFYRLLHRSKTISLVYNNLPNEETGEISRFIKQLQYESGFDITTRHFRQRVKFTKPKPISVNKDNEVLKKLEAYNKLGNRTARRLSASALNTLIACPLQFYFKYIAQIKEAPLPEEDISPALFGSILHKAAEIMYGRISKNSPVLTKEILQQNRKDRKKYVLQAVETVFVNLPNKKILFEGKGQIIIEVLCQYLDLILKADMAYAPFNIESLEEKDLSLSVRFSSQSITKEVVFGGVIDRVDSKYGEYRIIDYKTGSAEKTFSSFDELFDSKSAYKNKAIVQMYLYGLILRGNSHIPKLTAGIYNLKEMNRSNFSAEIKIKSHNADYRPEHIFTDSLKDFQSRLQDLLIDLFNPKIPFFQTEYEENCTYCAYRSVCSKE